MKKSRLSCITFSLTIFAMVSSAAASIIASDDAPFASTTPSHADMFAASSAPVPGTALTVNLPEETVQNRPDGKPYYFTTSSSTDSLHTKSHTNLWLLLIAASLLGLLSEVFHRSSRKRQ